MTTIAIVGLGNTGQKFSGTRHNIGADLVRRFARDEQFPAWEQIQAGKLSYEKTTTTIGETSVTLLIPESLMNVCGSTVAAAAKREDIAPTQMFVAHDDLETAFGKTRTKEKGSAAGHNGVRSIIAALATSDFPRIRIGIGRPTDATPVDAFVLQPFTPQERTQMDAVYQTFVATVQQLLEKK